MSKKWTAKDFIESELIIQEDAFGSEKDALQFIQDMAEEGQYEELSEEQNRRVLCEVKRQRAKNPNQGD